MSSKSTKARMFSLLVIVFLAVDTAMSAKYYKCEMWGDPHVMTLDGIKFDLVGLEGEFLIMKPSGDYPWNFEIKGVTTKTGSQRPKESRMTSVSVKAQWDGKDAPATTYMMNATDIYLDGTPSRTISKPHEIMDDEGQKVVQFNEGFKLVHYTQFEAEDHYLKVLLTYDNRGDVGEMKGVCGNMNDNRADDRQVLQADGLTVESV